MCHRGHRDHPDDRRHHRDDRRNRRHHRDGRRNHQGHRRHHRDGREHHRRGTDALPDDQQRYYGRASCPGSDGVRRDGDRRRRQEQDGHPADGACPGWGRRGCYRGGQKPPGSRGPLGAHGCRGDRFGACPGWGRRGCSRGEERQGAVRAVACQLHPHEVRGQPVRPGPAPGVRGPWRLQEPWLQEPWLQEPWLRESSGMALGATAPQGAKGLEAHRPSSAPWSQKMPPQELQETLQEPLQQGRQQSPALRGRGLPGTPVLRAWLPTSWGQLSPGRPWQPLPCRPGRHAPRGRTRAPCGQQGARWSRMPT